MAFYSGILKFLSSFGIIFSDESGFCKLDSQYCFTKTSKFIPDGTFSIDDVNKAYNFAEQMASNNYHRPIRSGGNFNRNEFDVFKNTFQGKLSEYAIYYLFSKITNINEPDLAIYERGKWDSGDFMVNGKRLAIKSAKFFSQLLLLETKDWNMEGIYVPDIDTPSSGIYDYFVFVRIKPNIDECNTKEEIKRVSWLYQIVGYNVPLVSTKYGLRKLTPKECFNLQGFPEEFELPKIADVHLYKQAGNSVVVPVINKIANGIYTAMATA